MEGAVIRVFGRDFGGVAVRTCYDATWEGLGGYKKRSKHQVSTHLGTRYTPNKEVCYSQTDKRYTTPARQDSLLLYLSLQRVKNSFLFQLSTAGTLPADVASYADSNPGVETSF